LSPEGTFPSSGIETFWAYIPYFRGNLVETVRG
jgi:hypothetical protein